MIDQQRLHELAIMYKAATTKRAKNDIIKELLQHYSAIRHKLITGHTQDQQQEILAIFSYQLMLALDSYKIGSIAKFPTYAFYFIKAVTRLYTKTRLHTSEYVHEELVPSVEDLVGLKIDIASLLSPSETAIYNALFKTKINSTKRVRAIHTKVRTYLCQ